MERWGSSLDLSASTMVMSESRMVTLENRMVKLASILEKPTHTCLDSGASKKGMSVSTMVT